MNIWKPVLTAVALTMATGCPLGGDDDDDNSGLVITDMGGRITLVAGPSGHLAAAEFWATVTPQMDYARPALDDCTLDAPGPTYTYTYIDAGADITLTKGADTIVAARDTTGGIDYFAFDNSLSYTAGTWDVSVAGTGTIPAGSIGSISVPEGITLDPIGTIVPGDPLDITFSVPAGANAIVVGASDQGGTLDYTCYSANDGTFTIPANVTQDIGATGTVFVASYAEGSFAFEGKGVLTLGLGSN